MSSGGSDAASSTSLEPLTPAYVDAEHKVYLEHLESALTGKGSELIHNIALTGGYGVGKSSVLQELRNDLKFKEKTVSLSLATLGYDEPPGDPKGAAGSVTNRIQKEIVKQLLYRERPGDVPGSRYRRRTGFNWHRGIAAAALASAILVVVLYLTHAADRLADLMGHGLIAHGSAYAILAALSVIVLTALQQAFHDQVRITQLGAGPANVSLGEASDTYFDEWLDEIVYFFEATKVDIVIVEDIDRFDDPHIFETLRELNTILNNSKQLDERNIRFVYAIKDSIFEQLGRGKIDQATPLDAAAAEVARECGRPPGRQQREPDPDPTPEVGVGQRCALGTGERESTGRNRAEVLAQIGLYHTVQSRDSDETRDPGQPGRREDDESTTDDRTGGCRPSTPPALRRSQRGRKSRRRPHCRRHSTRCRQRDHHYSHSQERNTLTNSLTPKIGVPLSALEILTAQQRGGLDARKTLLAAASIAQSLEELGYHRVWYPEHHKSPYAGDFPRDARVRLAGQRGPDGAVRTRPVARGTHPRRCGPPRKGRGTPQHQRRGRGSHD